jgi:hypothetical protein
MALPIPLVVKHGIRVKSRPKAEKPPDCFHDVPLGWHDAGMTTMSYLDRFLEPMTDALTPQVARKIVDLRADPQMQARVDQPATKAKDGTLTPDEDSEYKGYVEAADIMGIIQSKARRFLAQHPA